MHLIRMDALDLIVKRRIEKASDEDVKEMEEWFLKEKLGIKYYPEQGRKVIRGKVVPINEIYGSEDA